MNQSQKKEVDYEKRNKLAAIISFVLIGCVFFIYMNSTKSIIDQYARYTLINQAEMSSNTIDSKFQDAKLSIAAAAGDVAAGWKEDPSFNVVPLVESIKKNYSFDTLEFVDKNGINLMSGPNRFDASDREYFKEGIKGKTGLWINYSPRESKEYLVDFYSPVSFRGEIVGVLVGAVGSKSTLEPLTEVFYLGHQCIGVLYNQEERAIAASFGVEDEIYASDIYNMFNLYPNDKEIFARHINEKTGNVFSYEGEMGLGIACARNIPTNDWGFIIIIPSDVLSAVYGDFARTGTITLGCVVVIVYIYILYMLGTNRSRYTTKLREDESIIKGFSKIYTAVFMLDYTEGTALCLRNRDPSAARFDIREGATVPIKDVFIKYITAGTDSNGTLMLASLDNVMYMKTMMNGKEFFSLNYNMASGGKGAIDVADMTSEEDGSQAEKGFGEIGIKKQNNERYLLGTMELD